MVKMCDKNHNCVGKMLICGFLKKWRNFAKFKGRLRNLKNFAGDSGKRNELAPEVEEGAGF